MLLDTPLIPNIRFNRLLNKNSFIMGIICFACVACIITGFILLIQYTKKDDIYNETFAINNITPTTDKTGGNFIFVIFLITGAMIISAVVILCCSYDHIKGLFVKSDENKTLIDVV